MPMTRDGRQEVVEILPAEAVIWQDPSDLGLLRLSSTTRTMAPAPVKIDNLAACSRPEPRLSQLN